MKLLPEPLLYYFLPVLKLELASERVSVFDLAIIELLFEGVLLCANDSCMALDWFLFVFLNECEVTFPSKLLS